MVRGFGRYANVLFDEFHNCAKDFLRCNIHYTGKSLAAFLRVIVDVAAGARDPTADDIPAILVTPFVPVLPRQEEVDDICTA